MEYKIKILKDTPIDNMGDVLDFSIWTKKYNYLYPYNYVLFKDKEIKAFLMILFGQKHSILISGLSL